MAQAKAINQVADGAGADQGSSRTRDGAFRSRGAAEGSSQCAIDDVDSCKLEPWPVSELGPRPGIDVPFLRKSRLHHRPNYKNPLTQDLDSLPKLPLLPDDLQTCGDICNGPAAASCSGAATTVGCECIVISSQVAQYLGFMTTNGPIARCFQVAAYQALRLNLSRADALENRLGGRDVGLEQWHCPCNATYSASSCCTIDLADWGI